MISPAVLAFIILVIVASLGVYIINTGNMYETEGFSAVSRQAALDCEKEYIACLKNNTITDKSKCQTDYYACIKRITNPSVSTATPASSIAQFKSSSVASAGALRSDTGTYDESGNPTGATKTRLDEIYKLLNAGAGERGQTADKLASYTASLGTLTPEFRKFLEQVQSRVGTEIVDPTPAQLALAQGSGVLPETTITTTSGTVTVPSLGGTKDKPVYLTGEQILALYSPAIKKIKPHQKPTEDLPSMEPEVDDEDDTEYAEIQRGRTRTASIRQMIRDDVAKVVREEVYGSRIGNPYEVTYDYA